MNRIDSYEFRQTGVSYERLDALAIIRLARSMYAELTNLDSRAEYFDLLDDLDSDSTVEALLTINDEGSFDEVAYSNLLTSIMGGEVTLSDLDSLQKFRRSSARSRQLCFLQYLLERRLSSRKLIIDGLQGVVTTPFFGECLSADFRFASPDTRFSLCHVKYGLHPTTALTFFLPRFIGQGRSVELLLRGGEITAEEALELGLINEILPTEGFDERCVDAAMELCELGPNIIRARRMLYAPLGRDLESTFEIERQLYLGRSS